MDNRIKKYIRNSIITLTIILINILVFLYTNTLHDKSNNLLSGGTNSCSFTEYIEYSEREVADKCFTEKKRFFYLYGFKPGDIKDNPSYSYTLITSIFLHQNIYHLLGNMIAFFIAGSLVENRIRNRFKYILLYLVTGIGATLFYLISKGDNHFVAYGASGAVAGVMGVNLFLNHYKVVNNFQVNVFGFIRMSGFRTPTLILFFLGELFYAGVVIESNIAYLAHVGGFLLGLMMIYFYRNSLPEYQSDNVPDQISSINTYDQQYNSDIANINQFNPPNNGIDIVNNTHASNPNIVLNNNQLPSIKNQMNLQSTVGVQSQSTAPKPRSLEERNMQIQNEQVSKEI